LYDLVQRLADTWVGHLLSRNSLQAMWDMQAANANLPRGSSCLQGHKQATWNPSCTSPSLLLLLLLVCRPLCLNLFRE
jgi:hypothetical protein